MLLEVQAVFAERWLRRQDGRLMSDSPPVAGLRPLLVATEVPGCADRRPLR